MILHGPGTCILYEQYTTGVQKKILGWNPSASGFRDVVDDVPLESLNMFGIERLYGSESEIEQIDRVVVPLTPAPLSQDFC